jgi:GDP-L-fucose synthase
MLAQLAAYQDQFGLDYAFCIATNLFGPNDLFNEQTGHVIPSLISKFERAQRTGDAVTIWGSGKARRDFMFAPDAARALLLAGEHFTGSINIATGATVSIAEVVRILARVTDFTGDIVWDRTKPDGQMLRDYDVSRLAELGYRPSLGLNDALKVSFDWLRDNLAVARR